MAARPSSTTRSSSISVPRAPLPPLEDIISSLSPTNTRLPSVPIPRPSPRSIPTVGTLSHSPTFPRIIRASNATSPPAQSTGLSWADVACSPPLSTSPTRTRRPSAGPLSLRSPSLHRPGSHPHAGPSSPHSALHQTPAPFPRPAYLEHSALRHLLQTELPPNLPPSRYSQSTFYQPLPRQNHASLTPALIDDSDAESSASPPPRLTPQGPASTGTKSPHEGVAMVGSSPVFRLPTRWSEQDRHSYLSVSSDGRDLTYHGGTFQNGGSGENAGLARTNHPIPPACGIFYYEIEILSKSQKAPVGIGFTAGDTRLNKLPGWDKNSWGYHGDDGHSYSPEKAATAYGPAFGGGDIVGAGIDFSQNRAFFTKNGSLIGMVFDHVACDVQVFPSVGLRHPNESIRVNFGHAPFKYDIDDHVQQRRDAVWASVQQAPLNRRIFETGREHASAGAVQADADGTPPVAAEDEAHEAATRLVLNYLIHHGYAKTADALSAQLARVSARPASPALPIPPPASAPALDTDSPMPSADEDDEDDEDEDDEPSMLEQRLAIVRAVRKGDIEGALHALSARFPGVLARDGAIVRLKLRCRQFAKRAFAGADDADAMDVDDDAPAQTALKAALAYGRALRAEYKKEAAERPEVHALLERTWSVIAYHFPSEAGGEDARDALAGEVNQAILESRASLRARARARVPPDGRSLAQLGFLGVGAAVFADVQRDCSTSPCSRPLSFSSSLYSCAGVPLPSPMCVLILSARTVLLACLFSLLERQTDARARGGKIIPVPG
ncbi:hypothetical protein BC834DRAFT_1025347 [Gloeopeniophorella convolvens]|nr:hypothetical protein BC834DRAFT_1025347 [Gloeopeniophorella convolvens]